METNFLFSGGRGLKRDGFEQP